MVIEKTRLPMVLFVLGVLMVIAPTIFPLATVIYPKYFWYKLYPTSEDPANPTIITPGQSITLDIEVVYHDASAGITLPSPAYWVVTATISAPGYSGTVNFGLPVNFYTAIIEGSYCTVAVWTKSWTVPTSEGVTYNFTWQVNVRTENGQDCGTQTKTTYAKTPIEEPDGQFYINDKLSTQTTTIVVLDPTLTIRFEPTKNPAKITSVYIKVGTTTVTLNKVDSTYKATYTLPNYGTYTINGYITWTGSTTPIQKMSVTLSWGQPPTPPISTINLIRITGIALMAIAGVLYAKQKR